MAVLRPLARLAGALLLLGAFAGANAQSALQPGAPVQFNLPAQSYVSNYYVDVDASAKQLVVTLSGGGSADIDMFVRFGSPFPVANNANYPTSPQLVGEDTLNRWSHYHSFSGTPNESISVAPSSRVPLQAGRWYIAVINLDSTASNATLTASTYSSPQVVPIAVDFATAGTSDDPCDIAPWTDPTVVAPVGGNPGTTLGQQRQNALKYAVQQITDQVQPPVPITIHACWAKLGGSDQQAVIANASPTTFLVDEPSYGGYVLPLRYTWYSITEAVRQGGAQQCGLIGGACSGASNEEIKATFNADIGSASVIGGEPFYFGYTADTMPNASIDFISVAMHEITHGLGFLGLANVDSTSGPVGAKAGIDSAGSSIGYENLSQGPYDDVFDDNVAIVNIANNTYVPFLGYEVNGANDAARASALVSGNGLRWSESTAVNSSANKSKNLAAPQSFPQLYAPSPLNPGSTLSHTVQNPDLMNAVYPNPPQRTLGLAQPMLAPLGWSTAQSASPVFAQPIPSNWFDVMHDGHGFDFQLVARDPVFGDSYILVFYSYDANGKPEWYFAQGNLVDGVFVAGLNNAGNTLLYSKYGADHGVGKLTLTQQNVAGTVIVDFNQADKAPACRNADRSGATMLGIMSWRIGNDSGDWCMQPLIAAAQHASPDFNGHWYSASDSGWGMEILDYDGNAASSSLFVLVYYPDENGLPTWAVAGGTLSNGTANLQVLARSNGYCRTCAPPGSAATAPIGTMTLNLVAPANGNRATGSATFTINYPGGGSFSRTNDPITTLSVAP